MPLTRNTRSSTNRIGLAAKATDVTGAKSPSTPGWQRCAALSHGIGDTPIPPFLVWAAQNRLVPPLALLTEDALDALAKDSTLWTTHYDFDTLEGGDAPRRRCSNARCFDAWLPWTWADEALQFETFMSAFAKLVLLVCETLCTDTASRSTVQADTDQFIRHVSMRLRRPGNWRFIRHSVIDAVGTWRRQICRGVPWDQNLLAQTGCERIEEGHRHIIMHGSEWPPENHQPYGDTWSDVVESTLAFWRDKCECPRDGPRSAAPIPEIRPDVPKLRTFLMRGDLDPDGLTFKLAETTKFAKVKRVLARRYHMNPVHIGLSVDGCPARDQSCLAELLRGDDLPYKFDDEEEIEILMHRRMLGGV